MDAHRPPTEGNSQTGGMPNFDSMRKFLSDERVAKHFDEVWASLPDDARTALTGRLNIISDDVGMLPYELYDVTSYGFAYQGRFEVRVNLHFSPERLAKRDDEFVKAVIAHELAHAILMGTPEHDDVDEFDMELLTTGQAAEWGYTLNPITEAARAWLGLPPTNMRDAGAARKRKTSKNKRKFS